MNLHSTATLFFVLLFPLCLLLLENKVAWIKKIGVVIFCYGFGLVLGLLRLNPFDPKMSMNLAQVAVALSLPLLLFGVHLKHIAQHAKPALLSFLMLVLSVLVVCALAVMLLSPHLSDTPEIMAMLIGVYVGGTVNLNAIGLSLGVSEELLLGVNAADMLAGAIYTLLMISVIPRWIAPWMKTYAGEGSAEPHELLSEQPKDEVKLGKMLPSLMIAIIIIAAAYGINLMLFGSEISLPLFFLSITTLGLLASLLKPVQQLSTVAYHVGQYFLFVFALGISLTADFYRLFETGSALLMICAGVIVGCFILHGLACKLLGIDRDTFLVTSCAGILGPPFIGLITQSLRNHSLFAPGLACALLGFGMANYLGVLFAKLVVWF